MLLTFVQSTEVTAWGALSSPPTSHELVIHVLQGQKGQTQRLPNVLRLEAHAVYVWHRAAETASLHG